MPYPVRPTDLADLERLIAQIKAIKATNAAKASTCQVLLAKLEAHLAPAA